MDDRKDRPDKTSLWTNDGSPVPIAPYFYFFLMSSPLVIKISGSAPSSLDAVCDDIASLIQQDTPLVLVHGASAATTALAEQMGVPVRMIQSPSGHSSRYTDPATLQVYIAAATGQMNKDIVSRLQARGVNTVGLSGMDGRLLVAKRKTAIRALENGRQRVIRDDYSGRLQAANPSLLQLLLETGYTPVIAPLAIGQQAEPLNVDGDRAAAMLAGALAAEKLVILSNVPGLLAHFPDETSLVPRVSLQAMPRALEMAQGRMKRKILAAQEALTAGVSEVIVADARAEHPLHAALAGAGTTFVSDNSL